MTFSVNQHGPITFREKHLLDGIRGADDNVDIECWHHARVCAEIRCNSQARECTKGLLDIRRRAYPHQDVCCIQRSIDICEIYEREVRSSIQWSRWKIRPDFSVLCDGHSTEHSRPSRVVYRRCLVSSAVIHEFVSELPFGNGLRRFYQAVHAKRFGKAGKLVHEGPYSRHR